MRRLALAALAASMLACAGSKPAPTPTPPAQPTPPTAEAPQPPAAPPPSKGAAKFGGHTIIYPAKGLPVVAFRIAFQVGSIDDPRGKEGLTALTAALMAEGGTQELTSAQLLEALFPMAAAVHVQTDKELTVFFGEVHRDHAERYIPLLVATITRPRWAAEEFNRLREDSLQAIEMSLRTGDDEELGKAALDTLMWKGHPYEHYVGGTVAGLKSLTLEDAKAHAARVFTQDRMLVGIAGATDDALVARLKEGLAALPAEGAPLIDLPAPERSKAALIVTKEAGSTAISLGYPWALRRGDPDFHPMMVAVSALGEHRQFVGRLMRELRVKRGLNYGNYAYVEHFEQEGWSTLPALNVARRQQDFTVWLRPVALENGPFALRAALHQLERYAREGLTEEEFQTVRGFLEGYTKLWEQTPMRRLGYAMDDHFYGVRGGHLVSFRASLKTMTREEVNRAIRKWIEPALLDLAMVTKDGAALKQAMVTGEPSPIRYVAEKPDAQVLEEDKKFVSAPFPYKAEEIMVKPSSELFER